MSGTTTQDPESLDTDRPRPGRPRGLYVLAALAVVWFVVGLAGGPIQGKLSTVQKNDNSAFLPKSAESTLVDKESQKFSDVLTIPGFVVYQRESGLTPQDRAAITADVIAFRKIDGVAGDQVGQPQFNSAGTVASVAVPLIAKQNGKGVNGDELVKVEKKVIKTARDGAPDGLVVHSAGPGGLLVAFIDSFSGLDGTLLLAAGLVVVVLLLIVYRSPVLWFFPLFNAVLALGAASLVIYPLAKHGVITLNGQSQGILSVLVIGAGTDYALLLVSRYREELHNYASRVEAMTVAWKGAAPAIGASAMTVILGLICLTAAELQSTAGLGPVCAIGVVCTVAVMLTVLPVMLVLAGRWIFWPRRPALDHHTEIEDTHGAWTRFARGLARHPRRNWVATTLVLLGCVLALTTLKTQGLSTVDGFTTKPDAVTGTKLFAANFSQGAGAPAVIIADEAKKQEVIDAAKTVPGVVPDAVCVQVDYNKLASLAASGNVPQLGKGCAPPELQKQAVDGRVIIDADIKYTYDTPEAYSTVKALREAVGGAGANAIVGGQSAVNLDVNDASVHDRNLIIPLVLLVILIVLGVVLRSLLAPVLLIATVVLSFTATLGVSALVFNHVFHFANADPAFPLFAFVFLVALGIDYNIFLMTRVREETLRFGTREGVIRGLAVTGGVITSAGVVLAATFVVLGVLPIVFLAELGFTVAFGVLLDTILVRSVLVPALSLDIGKGIWWPSKLASTGQD